MRARTTGNHDVVVHPRDGNWAESRCARRPYLRTALREVRAPRFGELKQPTHERKPAVTAVTPEQVVEAQVLAFNARDLTEFLAHYATDAKMYAHPSTLIATGHTELSPYF